MLARALIFPAQEGRRDEARGRDDGLIRSACSGERHLTFEEGVCYFAPTLRGLRDLTPGPQVVFANARALPALRGMRRLVMGVVVASAACGPVGYLKVQARAREAVTEARNMGGERAAPYEYTAAVEYFKKAEEEGDHAAYQVAIDYGRRAEDFAKRATAAAHRSAGAPGAVPAPPDDRRGGP